MKAGSRSKRSQSDPRGVQPVHTRATAQAPPQAAAAYLYGIIPWPSPWAKSGDVAAALGAGVGDPARPIEAVPYQGLAALISRVNPASIGSGQGVRGLRRDMRAHANVLNRVVSLGATVLPAAFGLLFPRGDLLSERFLQPQYAALAAHLKRLADAVEVTLKVAYVESQAIQEVVAQNPQLARPAKSLEAKIELGKRIAEALRAKRERDADAIVAALKPAIREARLNDPGADARVLNASFLVPRARLPKFDGVLEELSRDARGRMTFDCVGPLPAYSFVDLRL
jgi:hypothetical protein